MISKIKQYEQHRNGKMTEFQENGRTISALKLYNLLTLFLKILFFIVNILQLLLAFTNKQNA